MRHLVADLKKEIRIALDRNNVSTQLAAISDIDTLTLDEIIGSRIEDAAKAASLAAPSYLIGSGKPFGDNIQWTIRQGVGPGKIMLPGDFLRLVAFQMSDWERVVSTAIDESNPLYRLQSSRYPGVRGCPQKPVVAVVNNPGGQVLEFYSCNAGPGAFIRKAQYLPIPKIVEKTDTFDGRIEFSEKLRPAVVFFAAYLVALTMGDQAAQGLLSAYNETIK